MSDRYLRISAKSHQSHSPLCSFFNLLSCIKIGRPCVNIFCGMGSNSMQYG